MWNICTSSHDPRVVLAGAAVVATVELKSPINECPDYRREKVYDAWTPPAVYISISAF